MNEWMNEWNKNNVLGNQASYYFKLNQTIMMMEILLILIGQTIILIVGKKMIKKENLLFFHALSRKIMPEMYVWCLDIKKQK